MTGVIDKPRAGYRRFAAVESPASAVGSDECLALPADLLDGGEIVLLAIKPSLWFVFFDAARWIVIGVLLLVVSFAPSLQFSVLSSRAAAQLAFLMIVVRLGIACLRWVSRFYVLTNRRVMRVRGVFKADILSCPLLGIRNTRVTIGPHERVAGLGTIVFVSDDLAHADAHWHQINKVDEVHARVRRAIEQAIDNQPRA